MRRRGFLTLLGAALTAPALPAVAGSGAPAGVRAAVAAHVRKYPVITVLGISKRVGVPVDQAAELLEGLSRDGLVGPIRPGPAGPLRASSTVYQPSPAIAQAAEARRQAGLRRRAQQALRRMGQGAGAGDWLTYLQAMCRQQGYALSRRALAQVSA